mgnify:CR=1 FL=1
MNIKEMTDKYIGYPPEIDEGVDVSLQRKAYKQGVKDVIKSIEDILSNLKGVTDREINDIEANITELVNSRLKGNKEREERAIIRQGGLMVGTLEDWYYVEQEIQKITDENN